MSEAMFSGALRDLFIIAGLCAAIWVWAYAVDRRDEKKRLQEEQKR